MIEKIKKYIREQNLLDSSSSKIIVGLSGGSDSVVLLFLLYRLGYDCLAAHCNFHLRGEESLRDEHFAQELVASWDIPFYKQDFNTKKIAHKKGISIEMAARDLRYAWFEQLRTEHQADVIAVAHHQDDSIETLLLNLIRGTGVKGLTGIQAKNGRIIRPLLCVSKNEILQFADQERIPYRLDSSNLQEEYTRNKIRLKLIPLLKSINPSIETALLRTMENMNETANIYEQHLSEAIKKVFDSDKGTIYIPDLQKLPSPQSVLFELLKNYGFSRDLVQAIFRSLESQSGKEFHSSRYTVIKDRDRFLLIPRKPIGEKNVYMLQEDDREIHTPIFLTLAFEDFHENYEIIKDKKRAYFDAGLLHFPLKIRKWEKGDKFVPFGMNKFQKLSDYFNNHKFSKPEKDNTWLLCSDEEIIWIIGNRTDNRYRLTKGCQKVCILKLF
ncbi:MAG: tRNA lysidine(34) synthetase TilS [Candidatus Azobacteroides sp.]|nr:tRNA lysidine(34) synthetase TilS [Candidatus Azobacteroides sp.]